MNNIQQTIFQQGSIEFYANDNKAGAFIDGIQTPMSEWPCRVVEMLWRDMDRHPGALDALGAMGITDPFQQLNQYVMCMYGELNAEPDFINFKHNTTDSEFCQLFCSAINCKHRGVLCQKIHACGGMLTDREVEICRLMACNNTCQDIAGILGISVNTVNTHVTNILPKIGVRNSSAAAAWAAIHLNVKQESC